MEERRDNGCAPVIYDCVGGGGPGQATVNQPAASEWRHPRTNYGEYEGAGAECQAARSAGISPWNAEGWDGPRNFTEEHGKGKGFRDSAAFATDEDLLRVLTVSQEKGVIDAFEVSVLQRETAFRE